MRMPRILIIALCSCAMSLGGCVVQYGDPPAAMPAEPLPPPVDFDEVEARRSDLLAASENHDRLDRIQAAQDLARRMKTQDPRAQRVALSYLQRLVAIEERAREIEAPALFAEDAQPGFSPITAPAVVEEDLGGPEEVAETPAATPVEDSQSTDASTESSAEASTESSAEASTESSTESSTEESTEPSTESSAEENAESSTEASAGPLGAVAVDSNEPAPPVDSGEMNSSELAAQARWMLDNGDAIGAVTVLSACRGQACWDEVASLYAEARDAHVHGVREAAGERFLAARAEPDLETRVRILTEVRRTLADLADAFPDSPEMSDVRRNIGVIQRELEAVQGG